MHQSIIIIYYNVSLTCIKGTQGKGGPLFTIRELLHFGQAILVTHERCISTMQLCTRLALVIRESGVSIAQYPLTTETGEYYLIALALQIRKLGSN